MSNTVSSEALASAAKSVREAITYAARDLVDRRSLVELVVLAAIAREHLLVVGPPGTAKSSAVRRIASAFGGRYFEYLLSRFTEPNEIFGPIDLRRLREGVVETQTAGMLPETDVAFLDEVFLGSTAILNTLLSLLNERVFRRGSSVLSVPLRVCVGASNTLPSDDMLAAFADRFLLRVFVLPVGDAQLEELLASGWSSQTERQGPGASLASIDLLAHAAREADLGGVRPRIAEAVRALRNAGIELSDRRVVKLQQLVAAATVLEGRMLATRADLWPIVFALPTAEAQALGRDVLRDVLGETHSRALASAAEHASTSQAMRALRLAEHVAEALAASPGVGDVLRLEALAREIDASFTSAALPPELAAQRGRLVETIAALHSALPN